MIQFLRSLFCLEFSRFRPGLILIFCAGSRVKTVTVIFIIPFTLYIGQIITVSVSCNPHAIPVYIRLVNRSFTVGAFRVHLFPKTVKPNLVYLVPIALPIHFSLSIYSSIHKTIVKLRARFILSKKIYGGLNFIWSLAYRTFDALGGLTALTGTEGLLRPDLGYKNSLMM